MGIPIKTPIPLATNPEIGRHNQKEMPYRSERIAVVYAPIVQKAACPILTNPRAKVIQTPKLIMLSMEQVITTLRKYLAS